MDPLCEKYYNMSPYAYCANNPVMCIDPDGKEVGAPDNWGKTLGIREMVLGGIVATAGVIVATIGVVGNEDYGLVKLGKAGRKRHMGIRPTVRGSVMNPNDHPHGGGEGRAPVGRKQPMTPWGKPAHGYKTRKTNNRTDKYIVKRRK